MRDRAIQILGGKCKNCGAAENLQLHHIKRLPLSVLWNEKNEYNKRAKEAFEHPERFNLLCKECHLIHHDEEKPKDGRIVLSNQEWKDFDIRMNKKDPNWKVGKRIMEPTGDLHARG